MHEPVVTADPQTLSQTELSRSINCLDCSHAITQPKFATRVDGAHERTFRNPGGYSFRVLCFSQAPGCKVQGRPSADASWFTGTLWSFALCQACGQHLGWHYSSTDREPFFGLIAPRLVGWK